MSPRFNTIPHVIAAALIIASPGTQANAVADDPLLSAALSRTSAGPLYSFDVHYDSADLQAYFTVDPSRPRGERITVSEPPKDQWTMDLAAQLIELDQDAETDLWCSQFAINVPHNATRTDETADTVTYSFSPVPEDEDDERMFPHLRGTLVIDRNNPAILEFSMTADTAFKPAWLATITQLRFAATCERIDDGRTRLVSLSSHIEGSIALKEFRQVEQWNVTSVRPASY